jgi:hypothetical protein
MTTSGTYNFNPSLGEVVLNAFARCGVRRTALLQEHMEDARFEANLMFSDWANKGVNLWKVDRQSIPLVQGVTTYYAATPSVNWAADSQRTVMVLDAVITTGTGQSQFDRVIMPISRTEYSQTPNKNLQAPPTVFWFDRLIQPTLTVWPVPDQSDYYTLNFYRVIQIQDAELSNGQTLDIPYRWLDALCAGLAARLGAIYSPDRTPVLEAKAEQAYITASTQDTENVPLYVMPGLSGYYRT